MKKLSFYLMVIIAAMFLAVPSFGGYNLKDSAKASIKSMVMHNDGMKDSVKSDFKLSDEVVKKLSSEQLIEILKYHEKLKYAKDLGNNSSDDPPAPILLIIFGSFVILMFIPFYFNLKKTRGRNQLISSLIEKGQEIPKEFLYPTKRTMRSDFHKGIILLAFGFSLCLVLFLIKVEDNFWTIGLIPVLVGIGYLVSFKNSNSGISKTENKQL